MAASPIPATSDVLLSKAKVLRRFGVGRELRTYGDKAAKRDLSFITVSLKLSSRFGSALSSPEEPQLLTR